MSSARKHGAVRTPPGGVDVLLFCRSELFLMGLERLLSREPELGVFTYTSVPPAEPDEPSPPERRPPAPRGPRPRVAVLSDRAVPDVASDCELILAHHAHEVVLLSSRPDISDLLSSMGAGVRAFVTEGEGPDVLLSAIASAALGRTFVSQRNLELLVAYLAERERPETAQERRGSENDLLRLLAEGRSTAEIASRLGLAPKTVRNRMSKLYRRLGVHSRAAAVRLAEERGMLDPGDPGRLSQEAGLLDPQDRDRLS